MKLKRIQYKDMFFYIIVIFIAVCLPSFFTQIIVEGYSDIGPHTDFALVMFDENPEFTFGVPIQAYTYPVYHLVLKLFLTALMGNKVISAATLLSLCVVFSVAVTRYCLKRIFAKEIDNNVFLYLIDFISICSVFFIGITGVLTEGRYYLGQGAPNLWHNPTYIMLRPVAWISYLYAAVVLMQIKDDCLKIKDFFVFATLVAVGCLIKPSFAIVLLPATAVMTIYLMINKKSLKPGFLMLGSVGITLLILIWQFVFTQTNELVRDTSEPFRLTIGSYYGFDFRQSLGAIIALNGIVLIYFIFEGRKHFFKDFYDTLSLLMIVFGMLEFFFMTDGSAGNFSWGYYVAVHIGTVMSITQCAKYKNIKLLVALGFIFLYQVAMGLIYLLLYYRGGEYLI